MFVRSIDGGLRTAHTVGLCRGPGRTGAVRRAVVVVYAHVAGPVQPAVVPSRLDRGRGRRRRTGQREPVAATAAAAGRRQARKVRQARLPRTGLSPAARYRGRPGHTEDVVGDRGTDGGRLFERRLRRRGTEPDAHVRRARDELLHRRRRTHAAGAVGQTVLRVGRRTRGEEDPTVRHRHRFVISDK